VDAELAALCSAAATTLVTLMTTDSWDRVKAGFTALWRQHAPGQARAVEADLEAARSAAVAARAAGDAEAAADLAAEWRSRLRRVAEADEAALAEVRRLTEEFRPLLDVGTTGTVVMTAHASGGSRVNQAGRDQTVTGG
jgi:regulator of protease activity HflC (stomatin/prohibitin superfamily)